jgi:hypothetical protein
MKFAGERFVQWPFTSFGHPRIFRYKRNGAHQLRFGDKKAASEISGAALLFD